MPPESSNADASVMDDKNTLGTPSANDISAVESGLNASVEKFPDSGAAGDATPAAKSKDTPEPQTKAGADGQLTGVKIELPDPKIDASSKPVGAKPAATPEPKKDAKDEPAAAAAKTPAVPSDKKVADPDLDALDAIKDPEKVNASAKENFKKLRETAKAGIKHYRSEFEKAQNAYNEMKAKAEQLEKGSKLPESTQKELDELRAIRAKFDITSDPEFTEKYDKKLTGVRDEILEMCKKNGMGDDVVKEFKEKGLEYMPRTWWKEKVIDPLLNSTEDADIEAGTVIEQKLKEHTLAKHDRDKAIADMATNHPKYYEEKMNKVKQSYEQEQKVINTVIEDFLKQPEAEFAKELEVPADATPEKKAEIEAHNEFAKKMHGVFRDSLYPKDATTRAQVAASVVLAFKQQTDIETLVTNLKQREETVAALTEELNKIKGAGRTTRPAGSSVNKPKLADTTKMSDLEAIEAGLAEAEGE